MQFYCQELLPRIPFCIPQDRDLGFLCKLWMWVKGVMVQVIAGTSSSFNWTFRPCVRHTDAELCQISGLKFEQLHCVGVWAAIQDKKLYCNGANIIKFFACMLIEEKIKVLILIEFTVWWKKLRFIRRGGNE